MPQGAGWYVRDELLASKEKTLAFLQNNHIQWAAVNIRRLTAIKYLKPHVQVWVYGLPEQWSPSKWRETLKESVRVAKSLGVGLLANPENGWAHVPLAEKKNLGHALATCGVPVGFVTNDGQCVLAKVVGGILGPAGGWGSPELYHHQLHAPYDWWKPILARWEGYGYAATVPSWGSLQAPHKLNDPRQFVGFFDALPGAKSKPGIVWPGHTPTESCELAVRRWSLR